jgi:hypothetical protein
MDDRCRPSQHGAIMGRALIALEQAGRSVDPTIPDPCLTCAFRPGMPNQMAATGIEAFKCAIGVDPAPFGCHHGMDSDGPVRMCAGYAAAKKAPFDTVKRIGEQVQTDLAAVDSTTPDQVRAEFEAWRLTVDPDGAFDDYKLARLYAKQEQPS